MTTEGYVCAKEEKPTFHKYIILYAFEIYFAMRKKNGEKKNEIASRKIAATVKSIAKCDAAWTSVFEK